ncbi:pentatricopeptide repeat-containing protein At2g37310 [Asparagus officinalis]|nr:pentatricopeptide repeat-containing protein At2g37310 [Asparagus officinalis]
MGHSRYARLVFDLMPERDIVSWNSIISGYSQAGNYDECLGLFFEMVKGLDGVMPNGVTVASMLHACSQMKDLVMGTRAHQFAVKSEIEMDAMLWNSVIGFYAKCARLEYARSLFDEMQYKDAVSYNVMITGYMAHGFVDKAMNLFNRMANSTISSWNAVIAGLVQNNQHSDALSQVLVMQDLGFRPNSITLSSILPAISFFSNLLAGKQVHGYAIRSDFDQNIYVTSALIDIYAKSGFLAGARCVFERTKGRSLIVWTAIISAYASHGDADNAIIMFNRMLDNGIEPDPVTFTTVLSACAHAGAVNEARKIYKMMASYEILPAMEQYACMVGVFSRQGMLEEAMEFISKMPGEPNAKIWGSLLNGAASIGDVEFGKFVYEKLVQIEPENTGNYIVMANLYSRVGRWEEAKIVREKLKGIGLSKIPGCSWIGMSYGLQVFVAKDASNERSDEIYMVLDRLIGLMREEGYVSEAEIDEESCF